VIGGKMTEVFINSKFRGEVDAPEKFVSSVVDERRKGNVPLNVNIFYDKESDSIIIDGTKGRVVRPLIVVKNGRSALTEKHV
jgi:DNA-directed RNA polymerase beta subunit